MIYAHSLGRAVRQYSHKTAFALATSRTTFQELDNRVARIAGNLIAHGFGVGDRLAILLPNETDYIELIYACSKIGVVAVPLNTRLSPAEMDYILADATPRGLIRHSSLPSPTARLPWERIIDQEPLQTDNSPDSKPVYDSDAVLALIYTSGTTGHSKGVALTHSNVFANIHFLNYWMPYAEGGVFLHAAPIFHIMDFPLMFAAPAFGTCQITIPKFSPEAFCEAVEGYHVTHTMLVPTMINLLTRFPEVKKYDLSSLQRLAYGGSPIAPELIRRTRELFPHLELTQGYGASETGFLTGLRDQEHTPDKLTSCGRTCPGIDLRVVDEAGKEVQAGQAGEFVVRGANVMRGYWNNPELTSRVVREGLYHTGDVGYRDADGYFYILDRMKDLIVTGGEKVYCDEVEAVIYRHPAVYEAAVFGIPDPLWGEIVMACVVLNSGQQLTADELISFCRSSLANFKVPRRVEFSQTELPKNASGKILKRALRDRFWAGQERAVG